MNFGPLFPELLVLLRGDFAAEQMAAHLAAVEDDGYWPELIAEAARHKVVGILYQALRQCRQQVPADAWRSLHLLYRAAAAVAALQASEWERVIAGLLDCGVELLVLKGAALTGSLYGDIATRPMSDLDMLIHAGQLDAARACLEERGYRVTLPEVFPGAQRQFECQLEMMRRDEQVGISYYCELHWQLIDSPFYQRNLSLDWFWETAVPCAIGAAKVRALGLEALLLHLCAHLALHHRGERLLWYCDVDRLLRASGSECDWDALLGRAAQFLLVRPMRDVLRQTRELLHTPVPDDVLAHLEAMPLDPREASAYASLTQARKPTIMRFWRDLGQMPVATRVRYFVTNMFPSAAYMRSRYGMRHTGLLPFYYLYRMGHGLADGARALRR